MSALDIRALDESELKKVPRPAVRHELAVFISEEAFDRAVERGAEDTTREVGGVLVGEVLCDERGPYLSIETTIDALHADEKGAELTFTHATWEHIHREMDTKHQGKRVVGWYHTHPGFGVFLSDRDQFIHKSFFDLPFQVALVYDPKSREHGLFAWRDDEVWRMRHYAIGARDHTWDGDRGAGRAAEAAAAEAPVKSAEPSEGDQSFGSFVSYAVFAIALALIAGFLGHCMGAQAGSDVVRQARVELAQAREEGAQRAIASLDHDLVALLRETMGDQAVRAPVEQALAEIDRAIAGLQMSGPLPAGASAALVQLQATRTVLDKVRQGRGSAQATLTAIERATRQGAENRTNLAHDVAEQRAGLGGLYAELATEAAKAGDRARARRLLATAAHLDPANRARYQAQLQGETR